MTKKFKIGWQKYEDFLEKQISSPLLQTIIDTISAQAKNMMPVEDSADELDNDGAYDTMYSHNPIISAIPTQLIEDIMILSSFDCWIAHTNFDITKDIEQKLDEIDGIEVLKIYSRYRFFIGIGTMFNFTDVRKNIEKIIIPKGDNK